MHDRYKNNTKLRLEHMYKLKDSIRHQILGEDDQQWRKELEYALDQVNLAIAKIKLEEKERIAQK